MKNSTEVARGKYVFGITPKEPSKALKLNDIVSLKSHPYQIEYSVPKIGAYARFTPPLMIVIEVLNKSTHDTLTGLRDSNQYKCLFYSTTEGKFEKLWFKGEELKFISEIANEDFGVTSPSINEWKKELIGKEVVLQTVDLELGKRKTFQDTVDGRSKVKDSNLLDYLPPVGLIIDLKYEDDHTKHSEKTGKITTQKQGLQAKIKWLNNESGKISEEFVPLVCLKFVTFNDSAVLYSTNKTYFLPLKERNALESNPNLLYKAYPVHLKSITFKHYYYVYSVFNRFSEKSSVFSENFPVTSFLNFDEMLKDGYDLGDQIKIQAFFGKENIESVKGKWYFISYIDKQENHTERIIYIQDFADLGEGKAEPSKGALRCNCLLRGGAIRNFRIEGIKKCVQMPDEFEKIFFERI
ncbi:hypothetical protein [Sphingobacterium bambusae]|uniref:Uncharacterized protein n=1 Tax=Sphingobacterium bambusae TaxID=662858 RepID=A0ABW6BKY3_9SPHI|nr:hypothetical protein [Sphingobacterium bambusae]WPL46713.1 hypothetical protein SCB77_12115 [Sphingobacterium bambusae]